MKKPMAEKDSPGLGTERDDRALVAAMAAQGDRQAFDEFYRRFEQAAYNLARYITRRPEWAEEAVQEAMLRVWLHARTFDPGQNVRAWTLQIVAREAIKAVQKQRRRGRGRTPFEDLERVAREDPEVDDRPLRDEAGVALNRALQGLSAQDRQLVALYFGAGLLQEEIGRICRVPQTTVSRRIRGALDTLRSKLSARGELATSLLEAELLGEALTQGLQAPASLRARVFQELARRTPGSRCAPWRPFAGKGRYLAAGAALCAAVAVAVGMVLGPWGGSEAPSVGRSSPPLVGDRGQRPAGPAGIARTPGIDRRWDFRAGPLDEFQPVWGSWRWAAGGPGAGMQISPSKVVLFLLPIRVAPGPLRVRITGITARNRHESLLGCTWSQDHQMCPYLEWKVETPRIPGASGFEVDFFLSGRYVVGVWKTTLLSLVAHEEPYPGQRLCLSIENLTLQSIELRSTSPKDIPVQFRDPEALIRMQGRPGKVPRNVR